MGPTYKIAEMLRISAIAATAYCEKVRALTGLGAGLPYKMIAQTLAQHLEESPSPERIAEIFRKNMPALVPQMSQPIARPKKAKQKKAKRSTRAALKLGNIPGVVKSGTWFQVEDLSAPTPPPNYLVHKSYADYERVAEEKLEHCPHGVPRVRVCAICEPKKFREMTGID